MVAVPERRRFTVEEYHCMGEAGILRPDERTELIRGEIIVLPGMGPGHAQAVRKASKSFERRFGDQAEVSPQCPIRLPEDGEPQPELALLRPPAERYATGHPLPEDVLLLVEVSDTSLKHDRETKVPLYAEAGIRETWLVNLPAERIEVYRDPAPDGYRSITIVTRKGTLRPLAFPDITIPCAELLP